MRLTSKKTLPVVISILDSISFTQTDISKNTKISIGRVNKIVGFLKEKGIIIKTNAKYEVIQPNRLIELVSNEVMIKKSMFFQVNLKKEDLLKTIGKTGAVLCIDSSLEKIDKDYPSQEIHVYEHPELIEKLKKEARGTLTVNFYSTNIPSPDINDKLSSTSLIQTIIDLHSQGNGNLTEKIALEKWKTMQ